MVRDGFGKEAVSQPPTPPDAGSGSTRRRDWAARTRTTAARALHYSRFVAVMKRLLPIAAAAILGSVIAYSVIPRRAEKLTVSYQGGRIHNDLAMTKPRLSGADAKGNPFVITAAAAIQDSLHRHRAELKQVQADMQFENQRWLTATAQHGFVDLDAGTLAMNGGIALYTDSGYELHTASALANLKSNIFRGNDKVEGHGPLGAVSADSFVFDRNKRQVHLTGHVHMTMYPKKVAK